MDNAATAWPKPLKVTDEVANCLLYYCANPGRSGHDMALKAEECIFKCRCKLCEMFGIDDPAKVIFTQNATHALNIVIKGLLSRDSHAVITSMEHNSVLRPLAATGAMYDTVMADKDGYVNEQDVEKLIKSNTSLIICTLSSNVCGSVQPFDKIAKIAKKHNIPFLLDASQGAGVIDIDMNKMHIDYLAAPGHKGLLGPTGTGVLCINSNIRLRSFMQGGTGSESKIISQPETLPDRFESGTLNVAGIAGLSAGIDFINTHGRQNIFNHESMLTNMLASKLSDIPNVRLIGYNSLKPRTAVLSVVIDGVDSLIAASKLNTCYDIAVRAGFHCAYTAHCTLGTQNTGTIRFSPGVFNTRDDIEKVCSAVNQIALQNAV